MAEPASAAHRDGGILELLRVAWMCSESKNPGIRAMAVAVLRRALLLKAGVAQVEVLAEPDVAQLIEDVADLDEGIAAQVRSLLPKARPTPGVN